MSGVLSIGMTHPRNLAGIGVDVRVAGEYAVPHAMALAAVSAQHEAGVQCIFALPEGVLLDQIAAAGDGANVVRIGALGSAKHFGALSGVLQGRRVVLDPVFASSAGGALYIDDPLPALRASAMGAWSLITPNLEEARALTGMEIASQEQMIAAGGRLLELGWDAVLIKGGHLPGDPVDVLASADGVQIFTEPRLPGPMRGTGCTLAAALACELASGRELAAAVKGARAYLRAKLARL